MKEVKFFIIILLMSQSLSAQVGNEPYRPKFHYSPQKNWMNDPNGPVYYNGKYHLFYQYNPSGLQPANISWGHAVSTDLVTWEEKPIAIPVQNGVMSYTGSVVVDWNNTSGFGIDGKPPFVAIYTGASNVQDQRIAYSNDEGETWINYGQNPVISSTSNNFRDPKVFWHQPTQKWVMAIGIPAYQMIQFFSSPNLINWTYQESFEQQGNISTFWECPDLFPLQVDNSGQSKWVLVHSVAPTAQYFIGDFNGQDFNWTNTMPNGILIDDFERDTYTNWTKTGQAFGNGPSMPTTVAAGFLGNRFSYSFTPDNSSVGKLVSPDFVIQKNYISFLIGGGYNPDLTYIKLVVNGQKVRSTTGMNEDIMKWSSWDVSSLIGQTAHIEIVDSATLAWGHINIDHIIQSDIPVDNVNHGQLDYGKDFYAVQSFSDVPGRRIWLAWMNNWEYATQVPTTPWKGIMTIPREVKLETHNGRIKLIQKPVEELKKLRKDTLSYTNTEIAVVNNAITNLKYKQFELAGKITVANKAGFSLIVKKNGQQYTEYTFDFLNKQIIFNRSKSGAIIHPYFAQLQVAPMIIENGYFDFHLFVDNSSAELFTAGGQVVMSNQVFPDSTSNKIELKPLGQNVFFDEFNIWNYEKTVTLPPPPPPPPPVIPTGPVTYLLFLAYPNPITGTDQLTVKMNNDMAGKINFELFNASGMLIYKFQPQNNSVTIPLSTIVKSKGVYFLKASDGKIMQTKRLLILDK